MYVSVHNAAKLRLPGGWVESLTVVVFKRRVGEQPQRPQHRRPVDGVDLGRLPQSLRVVTHVVGVERR